MKCWSAGEYSNSWHSNIYYQYTQYHKMEPCNGVDVEPINKIWLVTFVSLRGLSNEVENSIRRIIRRVRMLVRKLTEDDLDALWMMRLQALRDNPEAFGSTYE